MAPGSIRGTSPPLATTTGCTPLERGVAAHHAGQVPLFKEVVDVVPAGLVRMVFATETLALGINMPARSVVLEKLVKRNGENHVDLTPDTQLTGRAGRRGIDVERSRGGGLAWRARPERLAGLASTNVPAALQFPGRRTTWRSIYGHHWSGARLRC